MAEKADEVQEFREALEVLAAMGEKLAPFCHTVEELVAMVRHGLDNEGQIRLLMATVRSSGNVKR